MDVREEKETRNLEVLIDGRVYTLAGSCTEEHLQRIGRHIDKQISEARRVKPITAYNFDLNTLYIMINLVDDLLYNSDKADGFESESARLQGELRKIKAENDDIKTKLAELKKSLEDERKETARLKNEAKAAAEKTEAVKKTP